MSKWVDLKDNGGGWNCILNLDSVAKICTAQIQNEMGWVYFLIFKSENKELGHVGFRCKETRDRCYEITWDFLTNPDAYVMRLETDM